MTSTITSRLVLFAGDTLLDGPACYLAGVMTHFGIDFDYIPSDEPIAPALMASQYGLYILSDYPSHQLATFDYARILNDVKIGSGLLMVGGWESFHGLAGEYHKTPIADALPVEMLDRDDRVNSPVPWVPVKRADHPAVADLPWQTPPVIGGFCRIKTRPDANEILSAVKLDINVNPAGEITTAPGESTPLLVTGTHGQGRTAAVACDFAPHWVATMVDWGDARIHAHARDSEEIEVGNWYVQFIGQLLHWLLRKDA